MQNCDKCGKLVRVGDNAYVLSYVHVVATDEWDYERDEDVAVWCNTCGQLVG